MTPRARARPPDPGRRGDGAADRPDRPDRSVWERPGFVLWQATLHWQRMVTAALRPTGLTHVQFVLLAATRLLEDRAGPPSQRELADHVGTDSMMTSQVLRSLETAGLVERHPDPGDARIKRLTVTAEGRQVATDAERIVDLLDRKFFAAAGDRHDLVQLLATLAGHDAAGTPHPYL